MSVPPSNATIAVSGGDITSIGTVSIGTLGTDATYTYFVSRSFTNSSAAGMTDCGTCVATTASQSVNITGLTAATTYYFWVRAKNTTTTVYTVISAISAALTTTTPPTGSYTVSVPNAQMTQTTGKANVLLNNLGTASTYDFFYSVAAVNSAGAAMTNGAALTGQTTSAQPLTIYGLTPSTTVYVFLRARHADSGRYIVMSGGTAATTLTGTGPAGGSVGTPSSVTAVSAVVSVTLTTLGFDATYRYFLSGSPTNSTGGVMTDLVSLAAQTTSQSASLTLLVPSTTTYLFARAQNVGTGAYIFMTTTGVTLTTLTTGVAPTGASISVTNSVSTTANVTVTLTTLGTNANYAYYVSWCATNSTSGTMANVCLLNASTSSQGSYLSGLPAGTSPYLFARAKNVLTGAYTVMSASGTQITLSATGLYDESGAVAAYDPKSNAYFASASSISGSYAVIGCYGRAVLGMSGAGSAYVLKLNAGTGEWEHEAPLTAGDALSNDNFGTSVGIAGTYVLVGASLSDPGDRAEAGAAYVFERNGGTGLWEQKAKLVASDSLPNDNFGFAVRVNGTYAIVGAPGRIKRGLQNSGGAYVFERSGGGAWTETALLEPIDGATSGVFGYAVSISGDLAIVGAQGKDSSNGGAYIYQRNASSGAWQGIITLPCPVAGVTAFGCGVGVSGSYAVVGAYYTTVGAITYAGSAYVFEKNSGTGLWSTTPVSTLYNPEPVSGDQFGASVAIDGDSLVVACYSKTVAGKANAGAVYLYRRDSTTASWNSKMKWIAGNGTSNDSLGRSVALSGTHVMAGAKYRTINGLVNAGTTYSWELPAAGAGLVPPSTGTVSATASGGASATVTIGTLGTDANYTYVVSYSATNSATEAMTDCAALTAQTASQTVSLTSLTAGTTVYLWVRARVVSSTAYVLTSSSSYALSLSAATFITLSSIAQLKCTAAVTMVAGDLGAAGAHDYFLSGSTTNSTGGAMTDLIGLSRQTASQSQAVSGLQPSSTRYLFLRKRDVTTGSYTVISTIGQALTTLAGVAPSGAAVAAPTAITSISATATVTISTFGTNALYNYYLSGADTNSAGAAMTNLISLNVTASQSVNLTLLTPSTTVYLFVRAQNPVTNTYTVMMASGTTLTTLGTGSAPSGASISVTSSASTTAVLSVSMTTLGSNANYVYYVSWCATNSVGGTMADTCLLTAQTGAQTVKPSGLPGGTSPYLFVRAKNVLTGARIVMSASGTQVALTAAGLYYESAAPTAHDPVLNDSYGFSTGISGGYALVGCSSKDPLGLGNAGGVYVLELNGGTGEWVYKAVLTPDDAFGGDNLGYSVSVSGTYAVAGAYLAAPGGKTNAGAAYMYERNSGTGVWEQKTKLVAGDALPADLFGNSVSVSGTFAIVGAPSKRARGYANYGAAYVFERNSIGGAWEQKAALAPSDTALTAGPRFGNAVSVSGSVAIVGAYTKNSNNGGAYVFERDATTGVWREKVVLNCPDATTTFFGYSAAVSGTYAVVGAYGKTVNSLNSAGGCYVYERDAATGLWPLVSTLDNPDPVASDVFGGYVGLDGDALVVGCTSKAAGGKTLAGSVYLYGRNATTGSWNNKAEVAAIDGLASNALGRVSVSGTHVLGGAPGKTVNGGASAGGAYVWEAPAAGTKVSPDSATISAGSTTSATLTLGALGTDAVYTYVVSYSSSNSSAAAMTDCGTCVAQTTSQSVTLTAVPANSFLWVRSKVTSSSAYAVLSTSYYTTNQTPAAPTGGALAVEYVATPAVAATVTIGALGYPTSTYTYRIAYDTGTPTTSSPGTSLSAANGTQARLLSGLTEGTTYTLALQYSQGGAAWVTLGSTQTAVLGVLPTATLTNLIANDTAITGTATLTTLGTVDPYTYRVAWSATGAPTAASTSAGDLSGVTTPQGVGFTGVNGTSYYVAVQYSQNGANWVNVSSVGTVTAGAVPPSGGLVTVNSTTTTTASVTANITTLGTDATYAYYVSFSSTNSSGASMVDGASLSGALGAQTVTATGLTPGSTTYMWIRAKNTGTNAYTVLSSTGASCIAKITPAAGLVTVNSTTTTTASITASITALGTDATYAYYVSFSSTNSSGASMTDGASLSGTLGAQTVTATGLTPGSTTYMWIRAKNTATNAYTVLSSTGASCVAKITPAAGLVTVNSTTTTTASITASITTLGTDATYAYYVSFSSTNSSGASMTDGASLSGATGAQTVTATGLTPGGTTYMWIRAKNTGTNAFTVLSSTGASCIAKITPAAGLVTVNSSTTTTASITASITALGTDATYAYYVSFSSTNSSGASMVDGASLSGTLGAQTVTATGLTPGSTTYMWIRAKNTGTNAYTVLSSTGASCVAKITPAAGLVTVNSTTTTTASITASITTLGTDATYAYYVSFSSTNSSGASMTDGASLSGATGAQTVTVTGLTPGGTTYMWIRAKDIGTNAFTVLSATGASCIAKITPAASLVTVNSTTTTAASITASITTLGTDATYAYYVSFSSTNSSGASMTDGASLSGTLGAQTVTATGLTPGSTTYMWIRAKNIGTNAYMVLSPTGASCIAKITPAAGLVTVNSSTTTTASVTATMTTLGTDATYTYYVSFSSTNSSGASMTDGASLSGATGAQTVTVTALTPGGTTYMWVRAKDTGTNAYTVLSSSGAQCIAKIAPAANDVTLNSVAPTTASITATIITLGTDASYAYYVSFSATNSSVATMTDGASLSGVTGAQTVNVTGLPPATTSYLWVRAKNTSTGIYSTLSSSGIQCVTYIALSYTGGAITTSVSGGANGAIAAITVSGGSGTYTSYSWASATGGTTITAQNSAAKTSLSSATYTLTVTDSDSHSADFVFVVGVTPALVVSAPGTVTHCTVYSSADGSIGNSGVIGGLGGKSYSWASSPGASDVSGVATPGPLQGLRAGTYVLTARDSQDTLAHQSFAVGEPIDATVTVVHETRSAPGSITITARGGLGSFAYAWTRDGVAFVETGASLTNLAVGRYVCTITTSLFFKVVQASVGTFMTTLVANPTTIRAEWSAVTGSVGYTAEYRRGADAAWAMYQRSPSTSAVFQGLQPQTAYDLRVSALGAIGAATVCNADSISTPANVIASYGKAAFLAGRSYDITSAQRAAATGVTLNVTAMVEAAFSAGDRITVAASLNGETRRLQGRVAKRELAYAVDRGLVLYVPFDPSDSETEQSAILTRRDGSTENLAYSAAADTITVDGEEYGAGDRLYIDGLRVTLAQAV